MHPSPEFREVRAARAPRLLLSVALAAAVLAARAAPQNAPAHAAPDAGKPAQAVAGQVSAADGARALIQDTADKVISMLRDPALDSHARRAKIVELVDGRIDIGVVTKLVLAKNYSRFTAEQLKDFRKEFREHLIATYYRNAEAARFSTIEIYDSREEERGDWTVRSRVISEQDKTMIDYRLRKAKDTGAWLIIDITIENVSLVQNFRSQFQEVLSDSDPDQLIQMLRNKNAKAAVDDMATDKAADASGDGDKAKSKPADGSNGPGGNSVLGGAGGSGGGGDAGGSSSGGGSDPHPRH